MSHRHPLALRTASHSGGLWPAGLLKVDRITIRGSWGCAANAARFVRPSVASLSPWRFQGAASVVVGISGTGTGLPNFFQLV